MDDDEFIGVSISSDEQILAQEEIMDQELENFIDNILQEDGYICGFCDGTGLNYFGHKCPMCDGLGKIVGFNETVNAVGDRQPERRVVSEGDWQKICITLDSGATVDVMPHDELCQVDAVPCTGSRANRTMFCGQRHEYRVEGREEVQGGDRRRVPVGLRLHLRRRETYSEIYSHHLR